MIWLPIVAPLSLFMLESLMVLVQWNFVPLTLLVMFVHLARIARSRTPRKNVDDPLAVLVNLPLTALPVKHRYPQQSLVQRESRSLSFLWQ
jgi:hypothetical protein